MIVSERAAIAAAGAATVTDDRASRACQENIGSSASADTARPVRRVCGFANLCTMTISDLFTHDALAESVPACGFISTAGALLACKLAPKARDYLFASHNSVEVGHRYMLDHLNLIPLLDLGFRLGEGTGAALAMELIDAATRILCDIKTFEEVAIADAQDA